MRLPSAAARQYLYVVATAALAVAVFYGLVSAESVPLWLGLVAALAAVGNGTAAVTVAKQRRDGIL
jgi:hypothetical protein